MDTGYATPNAITEQTKVLERIEKHLASLVKHLTYVPPKPLNGIPTDIDHHHPKANPANPPGF